MTIGYFGHKSRVLLGFILAPLAPGCAVAVAFAVHNTDTDRGGSLAFVIGLSAVLGYPIALLIGFPSYVLMNRFGCGTPSSLWRRRGSVRLPRWRYRSR